MTPQPSHSLEFRVATGYQSGMTLKEAGASVGRSIAWAHRALVRTGVPRRIQRRAASTSEMIALYQAGLSNTKIGDRLGVSDFCVRQRLAKAGVKRRHRTPVPISKIIEMREAGLTLVRIAEVIDVTPQSISRRLTRAKQR